MAIQDNTKMFAEFKSTIDHEERMETSACVKLNQSSIQASGVKQNTSKRPNSRLATVGSKKSLKI